MPFQPHEAVMHESVPPEMKPDLRLYTWVNIDSVTKPDFADENKETSVMLCCLLTLKSGSTNKTMVRNSAFRSPGPGGKVPRTWYNQATTYDRIFTFADLLTTGKA